MTDVFVSASLQLCALLVLYWDHLLTLPEEIEYLWKRPIRRGAGLFFLNRYLTSTGNILLFYFIFMEGHPTLCGILKKYHQALLKASQVVVAIVLAYRLYAIWNCDKRILTIICILVASGAAIAGWSIASSPDADEDSEGGCPQPGLSKQVAVRRAIPWECMFVYDLIVFLLTVVKSYQGMNKSGGVGMKSQMPLLNVMVRDGTLYFLAITLANAANVGSFYLGSSRMRGSLSTFASSISVSLASRIILNLHKRIERLAMPSLDMNVLRSRIQFHPGTIEDDSSISHDWR
ncbi:hypothetical protein DL96DRAFT_1627287 [Flagelloscypha sp. PMI_526]|nr:hypothetical protein DL96DRAFT_1627287 [Flagelloscypha sp. PMI_526]